MLAYKGYPFLAVYSPEFQVFLGLALLWTLVWKGLALWKAGRQNQAGWFVALLLINTLGILEILYIYWFSKQKKS